MAGLDRRLQRTFHVDGRCLVVAYDHGLGGANHAGMADPARTLPTLVAAGADAVLTTIGIARRFERVFHRCGLIVSFDRVAGDPEAVVREATLLGADMGKIICYPWSAEEPDSVDRVRTWAAVCHAWQLPLMIETIPVSFAATEAHTPEKIGQAARIGCEIGADVVKMHYTGSPDTFRSVCAALYVPAVVLGGAPGESDEAALREVREAIDAGAAGVAIGRRIWTRERPERMVAALGEIIHGGAATEQAVRALRHAA